MEIKQFDITIKHLLSLQPAPTSRNSCESKLRSQPTHLARG
ncbi:unnamed protein product, partial [Rotaria magnacalcarata]